MEQNLTLDTSNLETLLGDLVSAIEDLDLSIDFLSAIMSGGSAEIIGARQAGYGRISATPNLIGPGDSSQLKENYKKIILDMLRENLRNSLKEIK